MPLHPEVLALFLPDEREVLRDLANMLLTTRFPTRVRTRSVCSARANIGGDRARRLEAALVGKTSLPLTVPAMQRYLPSTPARAKRSSNTTDRNRLAGVALVLAKVIRSCNFQTLSCTRKTLSSSTRDSEKKREGANNCPMVVIGTVWEKLKRKTFLKKKRMKKVEVHRT